MPNRLTKDAVITYSGGSPAVPYHPAYCTTITESATTRTGWWYPTTTSFGIIGTTEYDQFGNPVDGELYRIDGTADGGILLTTARMGADGDGAKTAAGMVATSNTTKKTCYPAQPYIPPVPPSVSVNYLYGWNSGANSEETIGEGLDGYIYFTACWNPIGMVVGLAPTYIPRADTSPIACQHAFYFYNRAAYGDPQDLWMVARVGSIDFEFDPVFMASWQHTNTTEYVIQRIDGVVYFMVDGVVFPVVGGERIPLSTDEVYMDVAMLVAPMYVQNPVIDEGEFAAVSANGVLIGAAQQSVFPEFSCFMADADAVIISGVEMIGGSDSIAMTGGNYTEIESYFPQFIPLVGVTNNRIVSELPGLYTVSIYGRQQQWWEENTRNSQNAIMSYFGGWDEFHFTEFFGRQTNAIFINSTVSAEATLLSGVDAVISAYFTPFRVRGYLDDGFGDPSLYLMNTYLLLTSVFSAISEAYAELIGSLEIGFDVVVTEVTDVAPSEVQWIIGDLDIGLSLDGPTTNINDLTSLLTLSDSLPAALSGEDIERIQYAINAATGALTTYRNFGFTGFQRLGNDTYAIRDDGLYRLRRGDDNGAVSPGHIDFGDTDFGTSQRKNVDSLYLGMSSAGEVFARLTDDNGGNHYYSVIQSSPTARVIAGRGTIARRYGLRLDITDITGFELDNIEFSVCISSRRRV